jgi:hypothetical protein
MDLQEIQRRVRNARFGAALVTAAEAAPLLGMSAAEVEAAQRRGALPTTRLTDRAGTRIVLNLCHVARWLGNG